MPYSGIDDKDLPEHVKKMPKHMKEIWVAAFNSARKSKPNDESYAFAVAGAAAKKELEKASKTEHGEGYNSKAFLVVPDAQKPSEWKLRIEETPGNVTVAQLGRAAAALGPGFRGQKAQLSPEDKRAAARKLISLYRKHDVDDNDIPEYLWSIAGMKHSQVEKQWDIEVISKSDEKQLIYGVVLTPNIPDTQGDVISSEAIELAAHSYMEKSRLYDIHHQQEADTRDVVPVESFIAPVDFTPEGRSQPVLKGSWVLVSHIRNSGLWQRFKKSEFGSYSIRGFGIRKPRQGGVL